MKKTRGKVSLGKLYAIMVFGFTVVVLISIYQTYRSQKASPPAAVASEEDDFFSDVTLPSVKFVSGIM